MKFKQLCVPNMLYRIVYMKKTKLYWYYSVKIDLLGGGVVWTRSTYSFMGERQSVSFTLSIYPTWNQWYFPVNIYALSEDGKCIRYEECNF